jgi:hypothetical protein
MKPPDEVKLELVKQWVSKAESDLLVAEHLLSITLLFILTP